MAVASSGGELGGGRGGCRAGRAGPIFISKDLYFILLSFQNGDAPLHIAVALRRKRMAKKLIRLGAVGYLRNNVSEHFLVLYVSY